MRISKQFALYLLCGFIITLVSFTTVFGTQNPVVWYQFNESSGTTANDSSGYGKNATLNGATWAAGRSGNAVSMNGSSQYVGMPSGIVNTLNDFTIAAWVRLNTVTTWTRIFDIGSSTTVNMFLTPTAGSAVRFAITTNGSGSEQRINGTTALSGGSWQHVAVTLSGNTGTLYVNGVQVGINTSMTLRPSSLGNTSRNYIGRSQYSDPYLNGLVDDFRIYDRALSVTEIQALVSGTVTPTPIQTVTPIRTSTATRTATPRRTATPIRTAGPVRTATPTPVRLSTPTPVTVTPTPVPGMPSPVFSGASYDLTGSNYYQSPILNISGNQPWTMACWVYQRGTSDEKDPSYQYYRPNPNYISKCVMGWGASGTKTANCLYVNPVTMNFEYGFDSASIGTTPNYSHYTWYHVTNTYDGTTQRIYINGNLVTTRTPGTLNLANTALTIGRDPANSSRYLTGKVQQVKVYNVALTAAQVSSLTATLPTPLNGYGISTAIPSALSFLDTSFYKKCYKTPLGVYIISSNRVGNHSLVLCGEQIDTVLAKIKTNWPAVYTSMMNYNCRVVIQSYMEQTTDVPEWRNLTSSNYARGMGGINGSPFSGCGEENVHHETFCAYRDENIIVHEFGHSLQGHGLYNGARSVYDEIRNAYNEAVSKGLWTNTYPGSNFNEYFANAVQTWYNVAAQSSNGQPNGVHNHVNLRSELQTYDPRLYNICVSLFNETLLPAPWTVNN